MKDVIIVSGGNIQRDFALDFLKKNKTEKVDLIAADRGVEFFKGTDWQPEVAVGDFDSLSAEGELYLQGLVETESGLRFWVRPENGSITLWLISDCWYMEGTEVRISYWSISGII